MKSPTKTLLAAVLPSMLLAGCDDDPAPAVEDDRTASGEILEGSISDEMLPLDRLDSQPPLIRPRPAATDTEDEAGDEAPGDAPAIAAE